MLMLARVFFYIFNFLILISLCGLIFLKLTTPNFWEIYLEEFIFISSISLLLWIVSGINLIRIRRI